MPSLRTAGWLLASGGLIALAGAFTPPYKQWYSPLPEALRTIAAHPVAWRVINGSFLIGTIVVAMGFAALAIALRGREGSLLALVGSAAFAVGTLFWVLALVFRLSIMAWAAGQFVETGAIPAMFARSQTQASWYFALFAVFAFGGLAIEGWSVFISAVAPRWLGWTMLLVGIVGAPVVVMIGPWLLYVPVVLFGMRLASR